MKLVGEMINIYINYIQELLLYELQLLQQYGPLGLLWQLCLYLFNFRP
mgnify:CR=1 FL=1|jgi:hypothetical protein